MNPAPTAEHNLDSSRVGPRVFRHAHRHERGLTRWALALLLLCLAAAQASALQFPPPEVERGLAQIALATEVANVQSALGMQPKVAPPLCF